MFGSHNIKTKITNDVSTISSHFHSIWKSYPYSLPPPPPGSGPYEIIKQRKIDISLPRRGPQIQGVGAGACDQPVGDMGTIQDTPFINTLFPGQALILCHHLVPLGMNFSPRRCAPSKSPVVQQTRSAASSRHQRQSFNNALH